MGTLGEAIDIMLNLSPALGNPSFQICHLFIQPCPLDAHPTSQPDSTMLNIVWGWHRCGWSPKELGKTTNIASKRCSWYYAYWWSVDLSHLHLSLSSLSATLHVASLSPHLSPTSIPTTIQPNFTACLSPWTIKVANVTLLSCPCNNWSLQ